MWRRPEDPRTQSNYQIDVLKTLQNRARAAKGSAHKMYSECSIEQIIGSLTC